MNKLAKYQQKPNTGALFKNKRRETDNHPMYVGTLNIEGREFWLSAWLNKAEKTGESYMSLKATQRDDEPEEDVPF